jgi:hypothetical protein
MRPLDLSRRALLSAVSGLLPIAAFAQRGLGSLHTLIGADPSKGGVRIKVTGIDTIEEIAINVHVRGAFGGIAYEDRFEPGSSEHVVPTTWKGQVADRVRAIVYHAGYGFARVDEMTAAEPHSTVTLALKPLRSNTISGRIISISSTEGLRVRGRYNALWGHAFFGIADGAVLTFVADTTTVAADGSFTLRLPDFANDPVVTSFPENDWGLFDLELQDARGSIPVALQGQPAGRRAFVRVAFSYPEVVLVTASAL